MGATQSTTPPENAFEKRKKLRTMESMVLEAPTAQWNNSPRTFPENNSSYLPYDDFWITMDWKEGLQMQPLPIPTMPIPPPTLTSPLGQISDLQKKDNMSMDVDLREEEDVQSVDSSKMMDLDTRGTDSRKYSWRKYGQKNIIRSGTVCSYYRCTTPHCPARKQVHTLPQTEELVDVKLTVEHNH